MSDQLKSIQTSQQLKQIDELQAASKDDNALVAFTPLRENIRTEVQRQLSELSGSWSSEGQDIHPLILAARQKFIAAQNTIIAGQKTTTAQILAARDELITLYKQTTEDEILSKLSGLPHTINTTLQNSVEAFKLTSFVFDTMDISKDITNFVNSQKKRTGLSEALKKLKLVERIILYVRSPSTVTIPTELDAYLIEKQNERILEKITTIKNSIAQNTQRSDYIQSGINAYLDSEKELHTTKDLVPTHLTDLHHKLHNLQSLENVVTNEHGNSSLLAFATATQTLPLLNHKIAEAARNTIDHLTQSVQDNIEKHDQLIQDAVNNYFDTETTHYDTMDLNRLDNLVDDLQALQAAASNKEALLNLPVLKDKIIAVMNEKFISYKNLISKAFNELGDDLIKESVVFYLEDMSLSMKNATPIEAFEITKSMRTLATAVAAKTDITTLNIVALQEIIQVKALERFKKLKKNIINIVGVPADQKDVNSFMYYGLMCYLEEKEAELSKIKSTQGVQIVKDIEELNTNLLAHKDIQEQQTIITNLFVGSLPQFKDLKASLENFLNDDTFLSNSCVVHNFSEKKVILDQLKFAIRETLNQLEFSPKPKANLLIARLSKQLGQFDTETNKPRPYLWFVPKAPTSNTDSVTTSNKKFKQLYNTQIEKNISGIKTKLNLK